MNLTTRLYLLFVGLPIFVLSAFPASTLLRVLGFDKTVARLGRYFESKAKGV